jgi:hypothetical protein
MRDEMDGRIWVEHHDDFSRSLGAFFAGLYAQLKPALDRIHRFEFDAPWRHKSRRTGPRQA